MLLAYYYAGVLVHPWYVPGRPNPDSRSKEEELTKRSEENIAAAVAEGCIHDVSP